MSIHIMCKKVSDFLSEFGALDAYFSNYEDLILLNEIPYL